MSGNTQKTPLGISLNRFAQAKALDEIQKTGRSLPCTVVSVLGSIVQVKFDVRGNVTMPNVTIPLIGSEYARPPIQPGCRGLTLAADAYLGGESGIGGGIASLTPPANLTALVFSPIGNKGWTSVDGNAYVIYGPNGVVLRDSGSGTVLTLTGGGIVVTTSGDVVVNGISFLHHTHHGGNGGSTPTGQPV